VRRGPYQLIPPPQPLVGPVAVVIGPVFFAGISRWVGSRAAIASQLRPRTGRATFRSGLGLAYRQPLASPAVSTERFGTGVRAGVDWRRAEFVLTLLGFLGFITLLVRITTIYSGLPAHPLFVHVPVILIPSTIVAAIVFMIKPEWFSRYGIALAVVSIFAMSSVFLTMQAGAALRAALNLQGQAASLISQHAQAAHILAIVYVLFTATLIVTFAAQRISGGMPTGLGIVDRLLSPKSVFTTLRVVLVLLSIGAGYMTFRTGDLGAKAVWEGRLQAAHAGFPGGPAVPPLAPPSGTGGP
jgi:hypothetical protein